MAGSGHIVFVGCLNRAAPYFRDPQGRGIAAFSFDTSSGALELLAETEGVDNPTFLAVSNDGRRLYATSEVFGWHEGVVTAYAVGREGRLSYINKQPTRGSITAQATLDHSGAWLLAANYLMGEDGVRSAQAVISFPLEADGGLGPAADSVAHTGSGPDPVRQERPHPHCVLASPDGSHMLVADLGIDRIIAYRFDPATGALRHGTEIAVPAGCGPRHLAWASPELLLVSGELDNTVTSLRWNGTQLAIASRASTLPLDFTDASHAADIHVAPDGRFVYVSNRGHDSIAVLALDDAGHLAPVGHRLTGRTPRNFALDPSADFVLVACQNGHEITVYRRDAHMGLLSEPVGRADIGSPMCVRFSPLVD